MSMTATKASNFQSALNAAAPAAESIAQDRLLDQLEREAAEQAEWDFVNDGEPFDGLR